MEKHDLRIFFLISSMPMSVLRFIAKRRKPIIISHSSLRMIQYSYCKLPIVTPHFSAHDRAHAFGYEIGNAQDLCQAFTCAKDYERESISKDTILDWTTITQMMFHD
jgi:hypothetical protein